MTRNATSHLFQRTMPVLEVADMERSIAFYRDRLGFSASTFSDPPTFTIVQRGTVSLALDASERNQSANNQYWAAYIYVDDVDRVYSEFRENDVTIHRSIEDMYYGCRDFDILDPDGYIIAIGQPQNISRDDLGPGLGPDKSRDAISSKSAS